MRKTFITGLAQAIKDEIDELTTDVEETPEPQMLGRIINYRPKYLPERDSNDNILTSSDRYGGLDGIYATELGAVTYVPAYTSDKVMSDMRAAGLNPVRQPSTMAPTTTMVRKTTTIAPTTKRLVRKTPTTPAIRQLPPSGVGAKPRSAAEIQLESERIKAETASKTQPSFIESTIQPFVQIGVLGIGAILAVNLLPPLLEAIRPRRSS